MKHFVLVSLLSCLAVGHMYADAAVVNDNAEQKKTVANQATRGGVALTVAMMAGAAGIGHMIDGAKGAFALGGAVGLVSFLLALQKVMKNVTVSAAQESLDYVYNKFFAEGQMFASVGISAIAVLSAMIYESGRSDGYWNGYSLGRERTFSFCVEYLENHLPTEILEKQQKN